MDDAATLLLTRPMAQAERFAGQCRARFGDGTKIVIAPLMAIRPVTADADIARFAGVIFSSESAIAPSHELWPDLAADAYVVGKRTAGAAEKAGHHVVLSAEDVDALFSALISLRPSAPLLHICGVHGAGALAERLSAARIATERAIVYDQVALDFPAEARELVEGEAPVILPLFSPRSATLFWQDRVTHAPIAVVAMSRAVAKACGDKPDRLLIAERPDAEAMLDAIAEALGREAVEGRPGAR